MTRSQITIVAEAAQGYEGNPTQARLLARAAGKAGADLVKFQLVYADELAVPSYQWHTMFKTLEMPLAAWRDVSAEAARAGVGLAFDVFGPRSLQEALSLGAKVIKIHVTDFFNNELVDAVFAAGVQVHASLGGLGMDQIDGWLGRRSKPELERLVLLYGFQAEPTAVEDNNLARLDGMRTRFPHVRRGWMDHSAGGSDESGWLGVVAVPYGISVLEKHITLARPLELEDSVSALDPEAFRRYVERIRVAEATIGSDSSGPSDVEKRYLSKALKVTVAARPIRAGETIGATSVSLKRAALDESKRPFRSIGDVASKRATRGLEKGDVIYEGDVE